MAISPKEKIINARKSFRAHLRSTKVHRGWKQLGITKKRWYNELLSILEKTEHLSRREAARVVGALLQLEKQRERLFATNFLGPPKPP